MWRVVGIVCWLVLPLVAGWLQRPPIQPPTRLHALADQQLGEFEPLIGVNRHQRRVLLEDLGDDVDYHEAWAYQKTLLQQQIERLESNKDPFLSDEHLTQLEKDVSAPIAGVDRILFLQHAPVYTLGTASDESFIADPGNIPIVRMDRGGEVTHHCPGQLTVYPILDLRHYRQDIHWYMRALEEAVIEAAKVCGVEAERDEATTGVWCDNHKIAAVGIKCRKWITQHGLAVNIESKSLAGFDGIVPCGLEGRQVGCINQFAFNKVTVEEFAEHMKAALEQVFEITLVKRE